MEQQYIHSTYSRSRVALTRQYVRGGFLSPPATGSDASGSLKALGSSGSMSRMCRMSFRVFKWIPDEPPCTDGRQHSNPIITLFY